MAVKTTDELRGEQKALQEEQAELRRLCLLEWATMGVQTARARNDRLWAIDAHLKRIGRTSATRAASTS
jgi:hypothetical protein